MDPTICSGKHVFLHSSPFLHIFWFQHPPPLVFPHSSSSIHITVPVCRYHSTGNQKRLHKQWGIKENAMFCTQSGRIHAAGSAHQRTIVTNCKNIWIWFTRSRLGNSWKFGGDLLRGSSQCQENLCSLKIHCSSRRTPGLTWRLPALPPNYLIVITPAECYLCNSKSSVSQQAAVPRKKLFLMTACKNRGTGKRGWYAALTLAGLKLWVLTWWCCHCCSTGWGII